MKKQRSITFLNYKYVLFFAGLILTMKNTAFAATDFQPNTPMESVLLSCLVPPTEGTEPAATLHLTLTKDTSVDYLIIYLNDNNEKSLLFNQLKKDTAAETVKKGNFEFPLYSEKTTAVGGVMKNTGLLLVSAPSSTGISYGIAAVNNNLYQIICNQGSQLPKPTPATKP